VNQGLTRYLAASGIEVETLSSFLCATTEALGAITKVQVMERALATVTAKSEALFIACSQLPTLGIIEPLQRRLCIPVWSSVQATGWALSRGMGLAGDAASATPSRTEAVPS
jgi:maleate cis-trans isomerase